MTDYPDGRKRREIMEPVRNEKKALGGSGVEIEESHPAFGMIAASRVSGGEKALFDSDIQHHHRVVVRINTATRTRRLNHDDIFGDSTPFIEVEMSEAQWASFVSSMNSSGVPCTIRHRHSNEWTLDAVDETLREYGEQPLEGLVREAASKKAFTASVYVPALPFEPRMKESMDEVRNSTQKAIAKVEAAEKAIQEAFDRNAGRKEMRELIRNLHFAVRHMPSNAEFAAKSLTEHAENVVTKARADIEAIVTSKAQQLGLEPGDLGLSMPALEAGDDES